MANYNTNIKLEKVAEIANMSATAFCRYFKSRTRLTLSEFIMLLRIGHACSLLTETDMSISEIAFMCGYNNLSNFNRQFRKVKDITPGEYLRQLSY